MNKEINIFWFRRDLRLDDNTALFHALSHKNDVFPIFIYDDNILSKLNANDHRLHFIKESINHLNLTLSKSKKRIIVTPSVGDPKEYLVPKSKHILVREGESISAGDQIVDGAPDPHDILKIKGEKELSKYIVDEIQDVYRLQGVRINDKHIEIITRQMLKRVKITDSGDTTLLIGEAVEKGEFIKTNQQVISEGGQPAQAEPLLLGITRASLSTKSWLSAASFQETTKVLTDASCEGKIDGLSGLKENVIMGRLIPAGTGLPIYSNTDVEVNAPEIEVPQTNNPDTV